LRQYHRRRDVFGTRLQEALGDQVWFRNPEGGLATWVEFANEISLPDLRRRALARGLLLSRTVFAGTNGIRMGFASMTEQEIVAAVDLLRTSL
ncbi:MAG: PLP-dependent aminotransferase family protein, partial [Bacteroidota bacterium]